MPFDGPDHGKPTALTFCFDMDGVIATLTEGNDYTRAKPIKETLEVIRNLYARGHRIIIHTARGSKTGIDWSQITREQLTLWKVPHHELHFGKPAADYYIDDRLISLAELKNQLAIQA
jgi:CMP-N,N'-diacetyllegionaminic acid synthase